ncbi:MAG: SAM-dependent methyltransferase [Streptomycetaceae bacterium]|nr:SAM-dependent methyltransferase [Streptomycetaceae bacterium]
MAVMRADEHRRPDAYLRDPHAHLLTGEPAISQVALMRRMNAPIGVVLGRGRFGDAVLGRAVAAGVRQVVELGAGSGTRAWRLPLPRDVVWYEVDLPGQLAAKNAAFERAGIAPSCVRRCVDADLRQSWAGAIADAGHDPSTPTVWIAEGLFYYLERAPAREIMRTVTALSAPGSRLVFDIPHTDFRRDPEKAQFLAYMADRGSPFVGAADHPGELLPEGEWDTDAYLSPDLATGQCRWVPRLPTRIARDHRLIWYAHAVRRDTAARPPHATTEAATPHPPATSADPDATPTATTTAPER